MSKTSMAAIGECSSLSMEGETYGSAIKIDIVVGTSMRRFCYSATTMMVPYAR